MIVKSIFKSNTTFARLKFQKQLLTFYRNACFRNFFFGIESSEQERRSSAALKKEVQTLKEQITNHEDVVNDLKSMNKFLS